MAWSAASTWLFACAVCMPLGCSSGADPATPSAAPADEVVAPTVQQQAVDQPAAAAEPIAAPAARIEAPKEATAAPDSEGGGDEQAGAARTAAAVPSAQPPTPKRAATPGEPADGAATPTEPKAATPAQPVADSPVAKPTTALGPCGEDDQPPCPLQGWMEEHLQGPLDRGDAAKLAQGLRLAAKLSPTPAYDAGPSGWGALSLAAADAAAAGDLAAAKQSCKACHKAWRKRYRAEHRMRPVP